MIGRTSEPTVFALYRAQEEMLGGMFGAAATKDEGLYYAQEVQSGRSLVTVTTDRPDEAIGVMRAAGALETSHVGQGATAETLSSERPDDEQEEAPS